MALATPRNKLKRNLINDTEYLLRGRKCRQYKTIEVTDRSRREESLSESNTDLNSEEEIGFDETDRVNLYPDLQSTFGHRSKVSSPGSQYFSSDSSFSSNQTISNRKSKSLNKPKNIKMDTNNKQSSNYEYSIIRWRNFFIIMALILLSGSIIYGYSNGTKEKESRTIAEIYEIIKIDLRALKEEYPQTRQLWTQVLSQIQQITSDSPQQPSTLFFVVPEGAEVGANCFINKLCTAIANGFQDDEIIMFDASAHRHLDPDDFKFELDRSMSGLNNTHCAFVQHIEEAVPKAVMLLHGYCDNENAIFKRTFIIFTIGSGRSYDFRSLPQLFSLIEETLMEVWGTDMRTDDIAALISRIATSPVLFKPEGLNC